MPLTRNICALPNRPDIQELRYSGANFARGAIARLGQTLQTRFPNKKFQILLPYENWKPGNWTMGDEEVNLFSLLDHYDESQLPMDDPDPNYFDRFIIYARDIPPATGGCTGDNGLNDCLYQCLKAAYGTFSKMPKIIEKPEYIKDKLHLPRNAPIPINFIEKIENLAKNITINVVGDHTYVSKKISQRKITLILTNGHYSLISNPDRYHPSHIDRKPKKLMVFQEDGINNEVGIYNSRAVKYLTSSQFQKVKHSSGYSFASIEKN